MIPFHWLIWTLRPLGVIFSSGSRCQSSHFLFAIDIIVITAAVLPLHLRDTYPFSHHFMLRVSQSTTSLPYSTASLAYWCTYFNPLLFSSFGTFPQRRISFSLSSPHASLNVFREICITSPRISWLPLSSTHLMTSFSTRPRGTKYVSCQWLLDARKTDFIAG